MPLSLARPRSPSLGIGLNLGLRFALLLSWLFLTQSSWQWLGGMALERLGLPVLGFMSLVIAAGIIYNRKKLNFQEPPGFLPLTLMVVMAIATVVEFYALDLPQLAAVFWLLSAYGALGFVISPERWQRGLSFGILGAVVIPYSLDWSVGLGFPLRLWTANVVAHLLGEWGGSVMTSQDIVVLENSFAQVELPCSGLKSLGMGTIFLLLITWLEQRRIGFGWLGICLLHWLLLLFANGGRVAILVVLGAMHQEPLAALLHIPLGVVGFITCAAGTWLLVRWLPKISPQSAHQDDVAMQRSPQPLSPWLLGGITLGFVLVSGFFAPLPATPASTQFVALEQLPWPTSLERQDLPLSPIEETFFAKVPGTTVTKQAFQQETLAGSFLIVGSSSWRSHHPPEACFQGNGFKVMSLEETSLGENLPVHWLSLNDGAQTAAYWFQSSQRTTAHYLDRFWSSLGRSPRNSWLMVSILFDPGYLSTDFQVQEFAQSVQDTLQAVWQEASHV